MEGWFLLITSKGLTPNQLYLLGSMSRSVKTTNINLHMELRQLKAGGWVDDENSITDQGRKVLEELEGLYGEGSSRASPAKGFKPSEEQVTDYLMIFPEGKLPSGKHARVHPSNLVDAFAWFFRRYDYSWGIVMIATQMYVDEYCLRNYEFMRTSQYFIRKQNTDKTWQSELANYCDSAISDIGSSSKGNFTDRVN